MVLEKKIEKTYPDDVYPKERRSIMYHDYEAGEDNINRYYPKSVPPRHHILRFIRGEVIV